MKLFSYLTGPIQVNTYYVYDESSNRGFVVDPGGHSDKLIMDIANNSKGLDYIVLTHGHGDHIGGVSELKKIYPLCQIVAGKNEEELLSDGHLNSSEDMFGHAIMIKPDVMVSEGDVLKIGNIELKILETPGHTPGGISILMGNVVFSGDTLFRQSVGRTDFYGGNFNQLINSIKEKLFTLPDETIVLPGHMSSTQIGFEKRNNYFV